MIKSIFNHILNKIKSDKFQPFYFCLIISISFLMFCTYTSPMFYFDYSPDNNTFFTVGKSMIHGIVPYKDLFEQKGPYVYLIHGIAYLFSPKSLVGMFPFEVISLSLTIWFVYKISYLFIGKYQSIIVSLLSPILYLFHPYFNYGDTTESLLFPCVIYLIYILIKNESSGFIFSKLEWLIQGIIVGIIFLSKYNQLGSWIAFYPTIFIFYFYKKKYKELLKLFVYSLYGFLISIIPWLFYFIITNSFTDFIKIYFYDNISLYVSNENSIFSKIIESLATYSDFLRNDPLIFISGFVGFIYVLFSKTMFKTYFGKLIFVLMNILNATFITYGYAYGTVYLYYELAFMPYILIPLAAMFIKLFEINKEKFNLNIDNSPKYIILSALIVFFFVLGVNNNYLSSRLFPNNASVTKSITKKRQQPAQLEFAKKINSDNGSNTTLLNYGSIDMGFYTASGVLPSVRYFQNYNFAKKQDPEIMNEQDNVIKHKKVEWVVLNTPIGISIQDWNGVNQQKISNGNINPGTKDIAPYLYANYDIVSRHDQSFESQNISYWLLRAKKHSVSVNRIRRFLAGKSLIPSKHKHIKKVITTQQDQNTTQTQNNNQTQQDQNTTQTQNNNQTQQDQNTTQTQNNNQTQQDQNTTHLNK